MDTYLLVNRIGLFDAKYQKAHRKDIKGVEACQECSLPNSAHKFPKFYSRPGTVFLKCKEDTAFKNEKKKKSVPSATLHPKAMTGLKSAIEIKKYSEVSWRTHTNLSKVTQNYSGRDQNYVLAKEFRSSFKESVVIY